MTHEETQRRRQTALQQLEQQPAGPQPAAGRGSATSAWTTQSPPGSLPGQGTFATGLDYYDSMAARFAPAAFTQHRSPPSSPLNPDSSPFRSAAAPRHSPGTSAYRSMDTPAYRSSMEDLPAGLTPAAPLLAAAVGAAPSSPAPPPPHQPYYQQPYYQQPSGTSAYRNLDEEATRSTAAAAGAAGADPGSLSTSAPSGIAIPLSRPSAEALARRSMPMSPEIEPCLEGDDKGSVEESSVPSSSLPMCIPGSRGEGRTYRVQVSSHDRDVRIMVDGEETPPRVSPSPNTSWVSGTSIQRVGSFLGSLFGATSPSADTSQHGPPAALLPHHYRSAEAAGGLLSRSLGPTAYLGSLSRRSSGQEEQQMPTTLSNILSSPIGALRRADVVRQQQQQRQFTADSSSAIAGDPTIRSPARGWARNRSYAALGAPPRGKWGDLGMPPPAPHSMAAARLLAGGSPEEGGTMRPSSSTGNFATFAQTYQKHQSRQYQAPPEGSQQQSSYAQWAWPSKPQGRSGSNYNSQQQPYPVQDIAVLTGSLPGNFGTRSLRRSDSTVSATGVPLSRSSSINAAPPSPVAFPICLICLEMLTPEDFQKGEAMMLECGCSGDVALRHRSCALEWNNAKGNTMCDICKQLITNVPPVDPELLAAREAARRRREPNFSISSEPTSADYVFDAIRVTWVVAVLCILFLNMDMGRSSIIGAAVGVLYALLNSLRHRWATAWRYRQQQVLWEQQRQEQEDERQLQQRRRQQRQQQQQDLLEPLLIV